MKKPERSASPIEYRREYIVSGEVIPSYKYCSALDDSQAVEYFEEMFEHLKISEYTHLTTERYNRYSEQWEVVDLENIINGEDPVEN